ncbi:MAG: glycosyltransferase family 2 protein [Candidatus Schekmanbacteria bacterium]|nr:MAG: glycosyltransferase family 2 protein [Candidatus Schekmanbacteria bacterium]
MTEKKGLASVIVLNWNGKDYIGECLDSLISQSYKSIEIIVVDNASTDGSAEMIEAKYSDKVKLIRLDDNKGFAGGNNEGIRNSRGEYILLINSDAVAEYNWIESLVKSADRNPESGMFASKILQYDKRKIIDNTGHLIYADGLNRGRGRLEEDRGQYDREEEVFFASGCAAMYRREAFPFFPPFDEDFFAYGDDTDIGLLCRIYGWKCTYVPNAVVYHRYSASTSPYSKLKAFYVERNRIWIAIKYFPLSNLVVSPIYTLLRFIFQAYGAISGKGAAGRFTEEFSKIDLFIILVKAYASAFLGLPKMIEKRRMIKKISKVDAKQFRRWLKEYAISATEIALKE